MRILVTIVLTAVAAVASAATDPIADCRARHGSDPAAHIACLEDALRARVPAASGTPSTAAVKETSAVDAKPVAKAGAIATAATAAPAASPEPTGLGAEQAKARQRPLDAPPERADVRIVSSSYNSEGLGTFRMADGQVWRETTPAPQRHKLKTGREYPGRIETSKIGGYRLYVEGRTWMYKVERLK
jgi:hypothetical protein